LKRKLSIAVFSLLLFCAFLYHETSAAAEELLIGVVMTGNTSYYGAMHEAFADSLKGKTLDGKQIKIILQRPFPDSIALSNAARKLIAANVDFIVSYGSPSTLAVMQEKSGIPLVYAGVYDPEPLQIAEAGVTGCGYKVPLSSLLRHLRSLKQVSILSVAYSSLEEDSVRQLNEISALATEQGVALQKINIRYPKDLINIAPEMIGDALFITGSAIVSELLDPLLLVFREHGQPSVGIFPDVKESGVVITLYQSPKEQGEKAAEMIHKLMLGQQPNSVKREILRDTELVFNIREAKSLGINPPINLISESTQVIK
jgi:ABC-type uncharacterized transport system substrate-binding protein